jgi:hypothetical protein
MNRRQYLTATTVSAGTVLAGCSSSDSQQEPNTSNGSGDGSTEENTSNSDGEPEFEVLSLEVPEEITQPDTVECRVEIENTGEGDGTYRGEIDIEQEGVDIAPRVTIEKDIPAGERVTFSETLDPRFSGFATFIIDDFERELMIIPETTAPQIEDVELVSEWNEFGDVYENQIDSAQVGEPIAIAVRYVYWHGRSGTLDIFAEYETNAEDGSQVDVSQDESERLTEVRGWQEWERWTPIATTGWEPDSYTTEVQIRDNQTQTVSEREEVSYELN